MRRAAAARWLGTTMMLLLGSPVAAQTLPELSAATGIHHDLAATSASGASTAHHAAGTALRHLPPGGEGWAKADGTPGHAAGAGCGRVSYGRARAAGTASGWVSPQTARGAVSRSGWARADDHAPRRAR